MILWWDYCLGCSFSLVKYAKWLKCFQILAIKHKEMFFLVIYQENQKTRLKRKFGTILTHCEVYVRRICNCLLLNCLTNRCECDICIETYPGLIRSPGCS